MGRKNIEARRQYDRDRYRASPERLQAAWRRRGMPEPTRPSPMVCECCGGPPKGQGAFHLDHCPVTKIFRGWLCFSCNTGIGSLGDSTEGLSRALEYLQRAYDSRVP